MDSLTEQNVERKLSQERLSRVPRYCLINSVAWLAYGTYYAVVGIWGTALWCGLVGILAGVLFMRGRRGGDPPQLIAYVCISLTTVGLLVESANSGYSLSHAPFLFCSLPILAAHQLGARAGFLWTIVALVCIYTLNLVCVPGMTPLFRTPTVFDKFLFQAGLVLLISAIALQAEEHFKRYISELFQAESELKEQKASLVDTQRRLMQRAAMLRDLAEFDQLSGLPNRNRFQTFLLDSIKQADEEKTQVGLLLIDLDGFKEINDTLGHACGDLVLSEVGERLNAATDDNVFVARWGGDEFTAIIQSCTQARLHEVSHSITLAMTRPMSIEGHIVTPKASTGAALYPNHSDNADELLTFADTAMYDAKSNGTGFAIYKKKMTEKITKRRNLDSELQNAVRQKDFHLVYQPLSGADGSIFGVEALVRWNHNGKIVSPSEFIPRVEASGLVMKLGAWVIDEALRQLAEWQDQGVHIKLSLNVSTMQFRDESLINCLLDAFEKHKVAPDLVDLEVTESVLITGHESAKAKIEAIKELGVSVCIDDFGTGYSSLSYLKDLPFDKLKIDQSFVKNITTEGDGQIAKAIVSLGHTLGLKVLAEGVETVQQYWFLRAVGCDEFQGFFLSPPLSAEDFVEYYKNSRDELQPTFRSLELATS